jgi:formate hydrogenlyase transcriptional activator
MDREDPHEQPVASSGLTARWDSVHNLFEHVQDALFLLDPEREAILDVNPAACQLLAHSREELLSLPISAICPNEMLQFRAFLRAVLQAGSGRVTGLSSVQGTGASEQMPVEVSAAVVDVDGRRCLMAFVRAIEEHRRGGLDAPHDGKHPEQRVGLLAAEPAPSRQLSHLLLEINNAIISNLTRESLFHAIAEVLRKVIPFDRAVLPIYDATRDVFRRFALEGRSLPGQSDELNSEINRHGSHSGWVFDHRRPLLKRDLTGAERELPSDEVVLAGGIRSYVIVPLIARGKAFGTLFLASCTPNQYSPADVDLLEEIAKQISLAIENMLAFEEIDRLRATLEEENRYLQDEIGTAYDLEEIIGQSPAMRQVFKAIETVAPTNATVLILGETGTGKELVARALHNLSSRRRRALVKVNCAALPAGLIESELFGHEKGAFTGALARRIGRFELANDGTIFLDEIGDLQLELQPKLLRVLQEGECERVGGHQTIRVNVRVIAGTNRDLEQAIQAGRFRADLYYRLSVFPIRVPPLRDRAADIPLLARYFTQKCAARLGKRIQSVPPPAMDALLAYAWPGNVRELENVIERAVILSQGAYLDLAGWRPKPSPRSPDGGVRTLEELEREHILTVLEVTGGRVSGERGAAQLLGMKPTTLEARMKKLGINRRK